MVANFVHLNLHTEYSIVDGIVRINDLFPRCVDYNMPAVALTDHNNLFAAIKFYTQAISAGVKPIIGVSLWLENDLNRGALPFKLILLAKNQRGYKNILKLVSRSYIEGQVLGNPIVKRSWLEELPEGIIVLSGANNGDIGQSLLSGNFTQAHRLVEFWQRTFPDSYYLEICRTNRVHEEEYLSMAFDLAEKSNLPLVATNAVCFLQQEDFEAHEARVCIHGGYVLHDTKRPMNYSDQQYFKSGKELAKLFKDIPESLFNTIEIAKRCNVELELERTLLPIFPVSQTISLEGYFEQEARRSLSERLVELNDPATLEKYQNRLEYEIAIINQMGFASYFLIVADFISWAKKNDIPVGPGRGSGAGSLTAYALGITNIDPLIHDLLFERFLNPERVSLPDFDVDFCMDGRDRVIDYVMQRYGIDKVAQIITYGTMAARAVVRDVGRVLGYPYGYTDKIAKLIPFALGMTLDKAFDEEELLLQRYKNEDEVRILMDLAKKLEGIVRNVGTHAGGVVIAPSALVDFMPLYKESGDSGVISQFDKDDLEKVGLVKFDFLGLRTLTIIDWTVKSINRKLLESGEPSINLDQLPLDDPATYNLLQTGKTAAVFQLESRIARDLVKRFKPDCFDDIMALVAIIRPGVLQSGSLDELIARKHGRAVITYLHLRLEPILRPTYGVAIYQEQVMQMAQSLAGYSLGNADLLRRAMGKKKPEEMVKQRSVFIEGAAKNGVDRHLANTIFDYMEKFASYGFNKSHSAAYALVSYQTAWLKCHHGAEFMAAVLSSDIDNTDKVVAFLQECKSLNLKIIPPDINLSVHHFIVGENSDEIIYGMGAIKGIGMAAAKMIVDERQRGGAFKDLFDLCRRLDIGKVNRRVLEALIYAGALDTIGPNRSRQIASLESAMKLAIQRNKQNLSGQIDLFSDLLDTMDVDNFSSISVEDWSIEQRLKMEKEVLGFYLQGHPMDKFIDELKGFIKYSIAELMPEVGKTLLVAGIISSIRIITVKSGNRMAIVTLEDSTGSIEVTLFDEVFGKSREFLQENGLIIVEGEVTQDNFSNGYRVRGHSAMSLDMARASYTKELWLTLDRETMDKNFTQKLRELLEKYRGGKCPVFIQYANESNQARLALGSEWNVFPKEKLIEELRAGLSGVAANFI